MLAGVVQDVDERVTDFARRPQDASVIAVREDFPATTVKTIEPLRDADREPLDAARERARVVRLGDQVQVVRLNRVLDEPEPEAIASVGELDSTSTSFFT